MNAVLPAVLLSTLEKVWIDTDFALWGKSGLLTIATHFVKSTVTEANTSAYLLIFDHQPRFLSQLSSQIERLTNGERLAVMNVAHSTADTAHCSLRNLQFKKRKRPTDVDTLQPGSLCYIYCEKTTSLCDLEKSAASPGRLGRRGSVADVKIGMRLHEAPTSHVKPAPAAKDTDLLITFPTAIEDGQMLATKSPPPRRLRDEIDEDLLFPITLGSMGTPNSMACVASIYTPLTTPRYEVFWQHRWLARAFFVMPARSTSTGIQYPISRIKKRYPVPKG